ncbi:MAG: YkgJ family cysteine cluster protein [Deltaproteobacteria bacterium]|nr:YkgJ family cysteine cluster protein [Deltaproteobacteria bacterium]
MSKTDNAKAFLHDLPRLKPDESFSFACHPQVACFNECCADLDLVLHPYDVLRLRRSLKLGDRQFIERFTEAEVARGTGFPQISLKMRDDKKASCPFVGEQGCSVYADRPGACRIYPLGRGAGLDKNGKVDVEYVQVKEDHCLGFSEDKSWTIDTWLQDQGLSEYLDFNDRHMKLMARWLERKVALDKNQFTLVFLALYRLDDFAKFIHQEDLFANFSVAKERHQAILNDEVERLRFAIEFLEAILFTN